MHPCASGRALSRLALLAVAVASAAAACAGPFASATPVPAASDTRTDTRALTSFSSVAVDGALNVVLAVGSPVSVDVEAPSNVLPLITTRVNGSELDVTIAPPGFASGKPPTVRISAPKLDSVALTGGASGTIEAMGQALTVSVSGSSSIRGIGTVEQLTVVVLGNSTAELGDIAADTALISAAGGAKATLKVAKQLTGTLDSGSVLTLTAQPVAQSVTVTGGASIVGP